MTGCADCSCDVSRSEAEDSVFRRVLWVALIANFSMFLVEVVAGLIGDSVSLQADALDFFGDAANYAISLVVVGMALKARAIAGLIKGLTMAVFGIWIIGYAIYRVVEGSTPDALVMGGIAFIALVVNVGVAVLLYQYRNGDSNMRSIWLCSRNDAMGNLAVMAAGAGVFASATYWPDLGVAAIIAFLNISASLLVIRLAVAEIRGPNISDPHSGTHPAAGVMHQNSPALANQEL